MFSTFLKYVSLYFFTIQANYKILGKKSDSPSHLFQSLLVSLIFSGIYICLPNSFFIIFSFYTFALLFIIIITNYTNNIGYINAAFTSIISFGINNSVYFISTIIAAVTVVPVHSLIQIPFFESVADIYITFIQWTIIRTLFNNKRLKKGMPFILKEHNDYLGILTSIFIIMIFLLIRFKDYGKIFLLPAACAIILLFVIYVWWKNNIKNTYIKDISSRSIEQYELEITKLKQDNDFLSSLVHKDNKIIPALIMSVEKSINNSNPSEQELILQNLREMLNDRQNTLAYTRHHSNPLPKTGAVSVDSLLEFMDSKAFDEHVDFSINIDSGNEDENVYLENLFSQELITENELTTLLADLIDNAIIAVRTSEMKNVGVTFTTSDEYFCIEVYDSGDYFDDGVLVNFGHKRITTHKGTGSGIGLSTAYNIFKRNKVDFVIDETIESDEYTKRIRVIFDKHFSYKLITGKGIHSAKELERRIDLEVIET